MAGAVVPAVHPCEGRSVDPEPIRTPRPECGTPETATRRGYSPARPATMLGWLSPERAPALRPGGQAVDV